MIRMLVCPDTLSPLPVDGVLKTETHCIWCGEPLDEHKVIDGSSGTWVPRTIDPTNAVQENRQPMRSGDA